MAPSESDAGLIAGSLENPVLFAELFDRHFDPIRSYLARRVGGQLAEDLASEVFLQAFRARSRYDDTEPNARPWLYGIASRLLSHHYRDEHRRLLAYSRAASAVTVTDSTDEVDARTDAAALTKGGATLRYPGVPRRHGECPTCPTGEPVRVYDLGVIDGAR